MLNVDEEVGVLELEGLVLGEEGGDGEDDDVDVDESVDEKDVVVFGVKDFVDFVKSNKYVLVEFYVFWCGYCKFLVLEYVKVVIVLKDFGVKFVKVDVIEYSDLV